MDVVILAAGKGERLKPLTDKIPKPLVKVYEKPILEWIIKGLSENNFNNVYVVVHYMKDKIIEFINQIKSRSNINFIFIDQKEVLGEVNAISLLSKEISDPFMILSGDIIIKNLDYKSIISSHYPGIVVKRTRDFLRKGIIEGQDGFITNCYYNLDKIFKEEKIVDFGVYILPKESIELAKTIKNAEYNKIYIPDLINEMIKKGKRFMYFEHKNDIIHITSLNDLKKYSKKASKDF